jgi:hypothetical protein
MICADCGTNLDNVPVGDPCPSCRSTRRNAHVQGTSAVVGISAGTLGIKVEYAPDRPWYGQWHSVRGTSSDGGGQLQAGGIQGQRSVAAGFREFLYQLLSQHYSQPEQRTGLEIGWSQGQKSGTEDALDLARRCVAAWEGYLKVHGPQSPI